MLVFKDLEFKKSVHGGVGGGMEFDNGFDISVQAGEFSYSTPRENLTSADDFVSFEVAVFTPDGEFTREFFPEDHHDDVLGWQDRDEITALMLKIQSKNK